MQFSIGNSILMSLRALMCFPSRHATQDKSFFIIVIFVKIAPELTPLIAAKINFRNVAPVARMAPTSDEIVYLQFPRELKAIFQDEVLVFFSDRAAIFSRDTTEHFVASDGCFILVEETNNFIRTALNSELAMNVFMNRLMKRHRVLPSFSV